MSEQKKTPSTGSGERTQSARWDMEEMERRAKDRAERDKELQEEDKLRALGKSSKKRSSSKAEPTAEDIAAEKSEKLILESAIGKTQVVQGGPTGRAPGFYCKICDCTLKDSTSYMDHKNGKKHLKKMGVDMKAQREDVTDVIAKLESMKRKAEAPKVNRYDLDARLEEVQRREEEERAEKRERKKQKKNERKGGDTVDDGGMDPAMAAMMGSLLKTKVMLFKLSTVALALIASSSVLAAYPPPRFSYVHNEQQVLAPLVSSVEAETIPHSYFVVFKDGVRVNDHSAWVQDLHESSLAASSASGCHGDDEAVPVPSFNGIKHVYDMDKFQGLAGHFSPDVLNEIRKHPDVAYIEPDQVVYANEIQRNAPWGLARISHRKKLTLATYNKYDHNPDAGEGVTAFVIDTGISVKHEEFQGRASWGKTIPQGDQDQDGNGHGTHCAGTIGSRKYGVAKKTKLVAVKVLGSNGSGSMSDVIAGVDYAVGRHLKLKAKKGNKYRGSVANMSLGGGRSRPLNSAITNAIGTGLHFAVAAGNDNADACRSSPADVEAAITVGASTRQDTRAYFSNYGTCVDIFGPGLDIESTWTGSKNAKNTISGTSMASPHVAGLVAYYLSVTPSDDSGFYGGVITPKEMKALLIAKATRDILTGVPSNTPNLLIYNDAVPSHYNIW
ncbi:serine protease [Podila humilis]|nr:serine protease [Podila humilis]